MGTRNATTWFRYILLAGCLLTTIAARAKDTEQQTVFYADTVSHVMHFRILYPVNKIHIREDYMQNKDNLRRIKEYLKKSPRIDSIVIYSYASPEGPYRFNKYLSDNRGKAAKEYILSHIPEERNFDESLIRLSPKAENWEGLREEIIAGYDRKDKAEVLQLLDSNLPDAQKKQRLIRLNRGRPWRYILKHIMPKLRYATWVSVWQTIPVEQAVRVRPSLAVQPQWPVTVPHRSFPPLEDSRTVLAVKTNLLYDALSWANFAIEVPIRKKYSILYYHQFPWWNWGENHNEFCNRFLSIGAEARWWFKPMPTDAVGKRIKRDRLVGHFLGLYAESGKWDFNRKRDICYQGEHWSVGLSYGYSMPIGNRLNLEFSISAGYASVPHRGYTPSEDYSELYHTSEKDGRWHYFGPTKAQISLVLPFITRFKRGGRP